MFYDKSDWIVIENHHEQIVLRKLWDKVREIDKSISRGKRNKRGELAPLSVFLYCDSCGYKMKQEYIRGAKNLRYSTYISLLEIKVNIGNIVKITDVLGIEGNTGYSTGCHCHYCIRPRFSAGNAFNVSEISDIPNALGVYDDRYTTTVKKTVTLSIDGKTYSGTLTEK